GGVGPTARRLARARRDARAARAVVSRAVLAPARVRGPGGRRGERAVRAASPPAGGAPYGAAPRARAAGLGRPDGASGARGRRAPGWRAGERGNAAGAGGAGLRSRGDDAARDDCALPPRAHPRWRARRQAGRVRRRLVSPPTRPRSAALLSAVSTRGAAGR